MEKFLEQFAKIPLQQKIAIAVGGVVLIGVMTYLLSVSRPRRSTASSFCARSSV